MERKMLNNKIIKEFGALPTPFYFYDMEILDRTLEVLTGESKKHGYVVHYALKANSNTKIVGKMAEFGLGADCVSGNEIIRAIECGIPADKIVFAGVGKSDWEIEIALQNDIFCFNCESIAEIQNINDLAKKADKTARIALRINPNVSAYTHKYITTGLDENKFGVSINEMKNILAELRNCKNLELIGLHFHIGSQITNMEAFKGLCVRINELLTIVEQYNYNLEHINVGGGLGIDYENPDFNSVPDFWSYFSVFEKFLDLRPNQKLHFELGRSLVAQCGYLISRVLYIKKGVKTNFAILDAGMTELIRPALYQVRHKIENLTSTGAENEYDVVGPICESSDTFSKAVKLPETKRGDLIAIRSAGAYSESMAFNYNMRPVVKAYYSDDIERIV